MSRLFTATRIAVTETESASPQAFHWHGNAYTVVTVLNQWRIDREWWRERIARDYFLVMTTSGLLAVLFQDRVTHDWFIQRLYD
jgi:hypothetical protein